MLVPNQMSSLNTVIHPRIPPTNPVNLFKWGQIPGLWWLYTHNLTNQLTALGRIDLIESISKSPPNRRFKLVECLGDVLNSVDKLLCQHSSLGPFILQPRRVILSQYFNKATYFFFHQSSSIASGRFKAKGGSCTVKYQLSLLIKAVAGGRATGND